MEIIHRRKAARKAKARGGQTVIAEHIFHRKSRPVNEFRKAWPTACKKAKVPGKLFHDLRRTASRNMKRAGVQETVAMKISGHKTRAVFDRYNITDERDIQDAMQKTQAYLKMAATERNLVALEETAAVDGK